MWCVICCYLLLPGLCAPSRCVRVATWALVISAFNKLERSRFGPMDSWQLYRHITAALAIWRHF